MRMSYGTVWFIYSRKQTIPVANKDILCMNNVEEHTQIHQL